MDLPNRQAIIPPGVQSVSNINTGNKSVATTDA